MERAGSGVRGGVVVVRTVISHINRYRVGEGFKKKFQQQTFKAKKKIIGLK